MCPVFLPLEPWPALQTKQEALALHPGCQTPEESGNIFSLCFRVNAWHREDNMCLLNGQLGGWMAASCHTRPTALHLGKCIDYSLPGLIIGSWGASKLTKISF